MDYTNCTIEESEKVFKIIEQYGFKKDFKKSSQDRRRAYYYRGSYCIFYRKGDFFIMSKIQEPIFNDDHLKSFLYYVNSSEKPYLKKFIQEYDSILREVQIKTYNLKSRIMKKLDEYNNNIQYSSNKNILKIKARDKMLKILNEIDNLDLY